MGLERALTQFGLGAGLVGRRARRVAGGQAEVSVLVDGTGVARTQGIAAEEFDVLVRDHQRRIFRVLMAMTRDEDAADTLTQECFLRAYRKRSSFRGDSSVGTWLVRIAMNLARDHARSKKAAFWKRLFARDPVRSEQLSSPPMESAERLAAPQASADTLLIARQRADAAWRAAEAISPQQRVIFAMRYAEEMSLEEIAEALDLGVGTVKSHLHRAVGSIRKKLGLERDGNVRRKT
jgi:RNA polymerase sigma-70 factor (ECF subfamily)